MYPRVIIAGTQSGVGKTTVSLGIMGALTRQGLRVQPYKIGPDFIDPTHHRAVTHRSSKNLDTWLMSEDVTRELFCRSANDVDLSIIEGVMGLFDGASGTDERGSAAHAAKVLNAPVILVMDARTMARSAAAVALGFQKLDPEVNLAGVILNRVTTSRHEDYLKDAIHSLTNLRVLGALRDSDDIDMPHRHLGLFAGGENSRIQRAHEQTMKMAERSLDLNAIVEVANSAPPLSPPKDYCFATMAGQEYRSRPRVAFALDEAFYFYYQDNLDLLTHLGCELVPFSPLHDKLPPQADLLYLGGGYPELHAKAISQNETMRAAIREFSQSGGYVYAECGGLMYLCESLVRTDSQTWSMCGVIPAQAVMTKRRRSLGYTLVSLDRSCLFGPAGTETRGHEFHYSSLKLLQEPETAFTINRERGQMTKTDGYLVNNTLAAYTHLHFGSNPEWARNLVSIIRSAQSGKGLQALC